MTWRQASSLGKATRKVFTCPSSYSAAAMLRRPNFTSCLWRDASLQMSMDASSCGPRDTLNVPTYGMVSCSRLSDPPWCILGHCSQLTRSQKLEASHSSPGIPSQLLRGTSTVWPSAYREGQSRVRSSLKAKEVPCRKMSE